MSFIGKKKVFSFDSFEKFPAICFFEILMTSKIKFLVIGFPLLLKWSKWFNLCKFHKKIKGTFGKIFTENKKSKLLDWRIILLLYN